MLTSSASPGSSGGRMPGSRAARGGGADKATALRQRADRGWQHARDRQERAVQGELAERDVMLGLVPGQHAHGGEQPQGDRQIEMAAFLGEVGGGEIDDD